MASRDVTRLPFAQQAPVLLSLALLYIDPVSGSIVLQALVAGVVGGAAFFRRGIARVFRGILGKPAPESDPSGK